MSTWPPRFWAFVLIVLLPLQAVADDAIPDPDAFDPDFYFSFFACRTIGSSLGAPGKGDGIHETRPKAHSTACARVGKKALDCITFFDEKNSPPVRYDMTITTDSSQMLIIESAGGSAGDWLIVKPATGRVVSTTRMVDERYLAQKLCHGVYLTGDEFKAMQAKRAKAPRK